MTRRITLDAPVASAPRFAIVALTSALALLTSSSVLAQELTAAAAPTLEQRVERLAERLEESRVDLHIPGMAIAVVKDDAVILARGFGLADVANDTPATADTRFAVGSTSKAFTATLVAMLVDEGSMSWDDPVRTHLPDYRLDDPDANERVQIRDLMCHRTGLASMNLLWYGGGITADDVLRTSYGAELLHPFREKFNYSNVSFLAAGTAAANAAGTDWHQLLARRIFTPLGMTDSNSTYAAAQSDDLMAAGYAWNKDQEKLDFSPMRPVDAVAPAGSINSSVNDMAQWVRLQLGRGTFDGTKLVSEAQIDETWTKHIEVGGGIDYGLGWFLRDWRGRRVIEHAGGIDGFTAEVAFMPDEQIGFVLLMNLFAAPLQESSRELVFDSLLGAWSDDDATDGAIAAGADDFDELVGDYLGNFGPFDGDTFEVLVKDGALAIDVPGQMAYELNAPDDEGKRQFTMTDAVAVRFNRNADGAVKSVTMFQGGFEFDLPRKGMEPEATLEIDLDATRKYLGTYRFEEMGVELEVVVQNGRLGVDVPNQMVMELHAPDDEGRWVTRVRDSIWVEFAEDDTGDVTAMTLTQDGRAFDLPRVADAANALPTSAELMELVRRGRGGDASTMRSLRTSGTIHMRHAGIRGTTRAVFADGPRMLEELDLGRFGLTRTTLNGDAGWVDSPALPNFKLPAGMVTQMRNEHLLAWYGDWRDAFETVAVTGTDELDGAPVYRVQLVPATGPKIHVMVDVATGRVVAKRTRMETPQGMRIEMRTRFYDWTDVEGISMPSRIELENDFTGRMVIEYDHVELNPDVSGETFSVGS